MRTDDQWFKPGDKVMRVSVAPVKPRKAVVCEKPVELGTVYCVSDFYEGPEFNAVMLVGFGGFRRVRGNPYPVGFEARAFRKVEEIKICVAAANHAKAPQQTEA